MSARVSALIILATAAWLAVSGLEATQIASGGNGVAVGWSPPRTPWGDPDLQGTYTNRDEAGIPFVRPSEFSGKSLADFSRDDIDRIVRERTNALERSLDQNPLGRPVAALWRDAEAPRNSRLWLVIDPPEGSVPPLTAEAQKRPRLANGNPARLNDVADFSLFDRCITRGLPGSMEPSEAGSFYEIVQAPGIVAIRYEFIHETRVIPVDGRVHVDQKIRSYMGDPRGHWEGNALVVETTNFNEQSRYRGASRPSTWRLIERFVPVDADTLEWRVTFDDPTTWTRPWTIAMNLTRDSSQRLFEAACHEGNYSLRNMLSAARLPDAQR